ncbi:MAG: inositol monophosphatase [Candidatus Aenigmarchaeota archaeon]|nr:inositol monophosphatase [Candidatus Aenigmarchaeota archaeon]NIP40142.1 inositol monophosphatase [Candidatus Aenigmarchaeota archaeon]NIQ18219.1 inositol monophosphatase [Candidatus Aenigmarchaeota archaeon]NIS72976.1 inositol monophosphatase [Candidatus Aenigmarchaeota archaeon]
MPKELDVAIKAAKEAGKILERGFHDIQTVRMKTGRDLITGMDFKSEKRILSILRKSFPHYSIYSEESGKKMKDSVYMWVVDPLDGTTNYSIKNPFFDVSIALMKRNEPVVGVVHAPATKEMFYAEKGRGAYLNGKRIRVSKEFDISKTLLTYCHNSDDRNVMRITEVFRRIKPLPIDFNKMRAGALEIAFVAAGRVGCYLTCGFHSYDVAAGTLLVREAGGRVTDFEGKEFNSESKDFLASNGRVHDRILELLKGI